MEANDPNREQLVKVAHALGGLANEVVFVGGATAGLLVTDPAAPAVRPTMDVDVVVEVASYFEYQAKIGPALHDAGFVECTDEGAPICAWKVDGIRVDVMPTDASVLGFTNPWYTGAIASATEHDLDGITIRVVSAPYFLATKFAAFRDRGESDYAGSHDLEDILAVIDGRPNVVDEVVNADADVRALIVEEATELLANGEFLNVLPGHVDQGRDRIVLDRLRGMLLTEYYRANLTHRQWADYQTDWRVEDGEPLTSTAVVLKMGHDVLRWDLSSPAFNPPFASQFARLPDFFKDVSAEVEGRDARPGDIYWWQSTKPEIETGAHVGMCVGSKDMMVHTQPRAGGIVVRCHCEEHGADIYTREPNHVYRWIGPLRRA